MKVKFPAIWFPAFKIRKKQLLDIHLLGVAFHIPPWDITFWEATKLTNEFVLFDTDDVTLALLAPILAVPKAVFEYAKGALDKMARDYYEQVEAEE